MRRILHFLLIALAALSVSAEAAETHISAERIEADAVWSGKVVVTRSVIVAAEATLRVSPGAEVRFAKGAGLVVQGGLVAAGEPTAPVTFTSDGERPTAGDWAGISFEGAKRAELARCAIRFAQAVTTKGCRLLISGCELSDGTDGLVVDTASAAEAVGNTVRDMAQGGIRFSNGSAGSVRDNTLERCGPVGISTERDSRAEIRGNKVSGCKQGIAVFQNNSIVERNRVEGGEVGIFVLSGQKECEIRGNRISKCESGILCSQFSMPLVEDNEISKCKDGVVCYRGSSPWLKNNAVTSNDRGIVCIQISSPKVTGNEVASNKTGIYLTLSSYARINENNFFDNGVHIELDNMSADWEQRVKGKPARGLQARNANLVERGKAVPETMDDGARLAGSVDAKGNWWGAATTAEMVKAGPDADIEKINDFHDVSTRAYEGFQGTYVQDRVDYAGWKPMRIVGAGPRKGGP